MNQTKNRKIIREIVENIWKSQEQNIDLSYFCEKFLIEHYSSLSRLRIGEILDDLEPKVKAGIKRKITSCIEKGITPQYQFSEVDSSIYKVRSIQIEVTKTKLRNINWRDFELLCKPYLEINGVEDVEITRKSKEGGIDFFGILPVNPIQGILFKDLKVRLIGQARHSETGRKISEEELQTFSKQLIDFKDGKGRGEKAVPAGFIISNTPVIGIFITNSEYTKGAQNVAKVEGIIIRDGDQIAEDLVLSPKAIKILDGFTKPPIRSRKKE